MSTFIETHIEAKTKIEQSPKGHHGKKAARQAKRYKAGEKSAQMYLRAGLQFGAPAES